MEALKHFLLHSHLDSIISSLEKSDFLQTNRLHFEDVRKAIHVAQLLAIFRHEGESDLWFKMRNKVKEVADIIVVLKKNNLFLLTVKGATDIAFRALHNQNHIYLARFAELKHG